MVMKPLLVQAQRSAGNVNGGRVSPQVVKACRKLKTGSRKKPGFLLPEFYSAWLTASSDPALF